MQSDENKKLGVLILGLAAVGFFLSVFYFGQSGSAIEYRNLTYVLKMTLTYAFLPIGLYLGLRFYSGERLARQLGGGLAILLIGAYLLGLWLH